MTILSETAGVLTRPHTRRTITDDGPVYGEEPALLDLLAEAVASDQGRGTAAGVARTGSPIDLGALDLWEGIRATVAQGWPHAGHPAMVRVPVRLQLQAWVNCTTDPVAEATLLNLCDRWVAQIREHLEPTKRVPLPRVACPVCGWDRTVTEGEDGFTYRPALVVYPTSDPVRVVCTVESCAAEWSGPAVVDTFMKTLATDRAIV